jgi:GLPGLI family protein
MKSITFTLLMSLVFLTTRAQNIPPYAGEAIDSVAYRISYETQSVSNPAMKDSSGHYIYSTDIMRLDIGRSKSCFYSYTNYLRDSLRYLTYSQGMKFKRANAPRVLLRGKYIRNYQRDDYGYGCHFHVFYKINEEMAEPQWQVIADSSTTILGYNCTLATTHYKGRDWRVWFTEDNPLILAVETKACQGSFCKLLTRRINMCLRLLAFNMLMALN